MVFDQTNYIHEYKQYYYLSTFFGKHHNALTVNIWNNGSSYISNYCHLHNRSVIKELVYFDV
jgi:hypothetical protein